jgi:hypothetical protein
MAKIKKIYNKLKIIIKNYALCYKKLYICRIKRNDRMNECFNALMCESFNHSIIQSFNHSLWKQ